MAILTVGSGQTYSTIQAAVDATGTGDTILVYPGTYNEQVNLPNGWRGTATAPNIIKAVYPARQPLNGGQWASDPADRAIVNGGEVRSYGFYNSGETAEPSAVRHVILDGFYFQDQTSDAIYFIDDMDFWVRNNMFVGAGGTGDNDSAVHTLYSACTGWLIQNNYFESTSTRQTNAIGMNSPGSIAEFNHIKLAGTGSLDRRAFYYHSSSNNSIVRYNFVEVVMASTLAWRFRDHVGDSFTHNVVKVDGAVTPSLWLWHENTQNNLTEAHDISYNTAAIFNGGNVGDAGWFQLGFQNNITANYNIFSGPASGNPIYAFDEGFGGQEAGSGTMDSTVIWNLTGVLDPVLSGFTATNTQTVNPQVSATTGLSSGYDNAVYGANLNVSSIPYKKADGTNWPWAYKFDMPYSQGAANPLVLVLR